MRKIKEDCLIVLYRLFCLKFLLLALVPSALATDFYIAPNGSNGNSGAIGSPFATMEGARDAIRELRPGEIGINGTTEVTISCWVNPDSKSPNDGILTCSGGTYFGLLVSGGGSGFPGEFRAMGSGLRAADNTVPANQWSHVAGVWKSGQIHKIYINGVEAASNPSPPSGSVDASTWFLGSDRGIGGRNLDGQFRGAYVWDRALNASEISGLAAATPTVPSGFDISKPEEVDLSGGLPLDQSIPELAESVDVFLRGGRYRMDSTFSLTGQDSGTAAKPITYKAYPGEEVILDGSEDIGGSGFALTNDTKLQPVARGRTYVKTITNSTLIDLLKNPDAQISVDDRMMQVSRFPNLGFDQINRHSGDVQQNTKGTPANPLGAVVSMQKTFQGDWQAELGRLQKARMVGYVSADWLSETLRVHSVASNNRLTLMDGTAYGFGGPSAVERAYVDNLLCEIDEPGEWFFDDTDNKLYIWPPATLDNSSVVGVWAGPSMIQVDGCSHVRFENITMQSIGNSAGGFLNIDNCDHVVAAGCTFRYCPPGPVAVNIRGASTNCGVLSSDYYDIENANRLYGAGSTNSSITLSNNFIENCHFTQIWSKSFYGKVAGIAGAGNVFRNNLMHNHNGQVVTIVGQDHLIELNEIFNTGVEEGDGGSFYQGASFTSWGNTFQHNFWHHIMCIPRLFERAAIYSDDGDLGDIVSENVFYKAGDNFKMNGGAGHYGEKNVMLDSIRGILVLNGNPTSMYNTNMSFLNSDPTSGPKDAHLVRGLAEFGIDGYVGTANSGNWNSHVSSFWRSRYSRMNNLFNRWWNEKSMRKYNDFDGNIFYSNDTNASRPGETTVTNSTSLGNLNDFVDPSKLNFKFKSPSPSWAPDIPFENIGLYTDVYRTAVPNKDDYRKAVRDNWNGQASNAGNTYNTDAVNARIYFNTGKLLFGIPDLPPPTFVDTTKERFDYDLGPKGSPVFNDWMGISPETNGDIFWSGSVNSIDRGSDSGTNAANRDLIYFDQPRTLEVKVANGTWDVVLNMGDASFAHDNMSVSAEGTVIESDVDSAAGGFPYATGTAIVTDGSLTLEFADNGGSDPNWVVTRLSLIQQPPPVVVDLSQTSYSYDLGPEDSPVFGDWVGINPDTYGDISWSGSVSSLDRGAGNGVNAANRDLIYSNQTRTLEHKVAIGVWNIVMNMGDSMEARDNMEVRAEGTVIGADVDSLAGEFPYVTGTVVVTDGSLSLEFSDNGGSDNSWVITRLGLTRGDDGLDTDNDGVTDVFEQIHYGHVTSNTDGTGDLDGDGSTDLAETIAGTDPTDSSSVFRILSSSSSLLDVEQNVEVTLTWSSVPGREYTVLRNTTIDAIDSGSWVEEASNISASAGTMTSHSFQVSGDQYFFLIVADLP